MTRDTTPTEGFSTKTLEIQDLLRRQAELAEKASQEREEKKSREELTPEPEIIPTVTVEKPTNVSTFIGLNGIAVSSSGELTKTGFFELLAPTEDQYPDIQFTPEQAQRISRSINRMTTGINTAVPMICKGTQCPFASSCIYVQENKIPFGRPCLIEKQLIEYWTRQYIEEFSVDVNNTTEVYMVSELAEFNIYEKRITHYLAEKHQDLLQDVIVSVDPTTGTEIINQEISRAWDLKERIKKSRMKVLEALMATRKERVKLKAEEKTGGTPSEQIADLKKKVEEMNRSIRQMKAVDAEVVGESK